MSSFKLRIIGDTDHLPPFDGFTTDLEDGSCMLEVFNADDYEGGRLSYIRLLGEWIKDSGIKVHPESKAAMKDAILEELKDFHLRVATAMEVLKDE